MGILGELKIISNRCRLRYESSSPEVPFQRRKIKSSQNSQVHNKAHKEPHGGESSDSINEVYFEVPSKRLVNHLAEGTTNRIEHKMDLHQGPWSHKTPDVIKCLDKLDEDDIADEPILKNSGKRRCKPARDTRVDSSILEKWERHRIHESADNEWSDGSFD